MMNDNSNSKRFFDPETSFSLTVPHGWQVDTTGQQGSRVVLFHPTPAEQFRANVNVICQSVPPLTRDEFVTYSRLQLKQLTGFVQLPIDQAATEREDTHIFEWMTDRSPIPIKVRQMVVFHDDRAYVMTATAHLQHFEECRPAFDTIFQSFELS